MNNQFFSSDDLQEFANISIKFAEVNIKANKANEELTKLLSALYLDAISENERVIFTIAQNTLTGIAKRHTGQDAMAYFMKEMEAKNKHLESNFEGQGEPANNASASNNILITKNNQDENV